MLKIDRKRINVSSTSLKYLYEIAAIPQEIREQFLQKLLKRKNSSIQKNVRLLKIIYYHVCENKVLEWNEINICNELSISKNMLYCHKSYLMKELRLLYFGWKEIEKKEFSNKLEYENEISFQFARSEKMIKIGMLKEAKLVLFKIEKTINSNRKTDIPNKLILFKVYSALNTCYYIQGLYSKLNFYFNKASKLGNLILSNTSIKSNRKIVSEISILLNQNKLRKVFFKTKNKSVYVKALELLNLIYKQTKRNRDFDQMYQALINIIKLNTEAGNFIEAKKYSLIGHNLSQSNKNKSFYYLFKAYLAFINLNIKKIKHNQCSKAIQNYYNRAKKFEIKEYVDICFLYLCATASSLRDDNNMFLKFLHEHTSALIIKQGLNRAMGNLYYFKFYSYIRKIKNIDYLTDERTGKKYLFIIGICKEALEKLDDAFYERYINFNKINNVFQKNDFFVAMLVAEIYKSKDCDFVKANHIVKQLEWLHKNHSKMLKLHFPLFLDLKFFVHILEKLNLLSKEEFLHNYEQKFNELSNKLLNSSKTNILSSYFQFSFIANIAGFPELKSIVKNLYWKLEKKYPELFKYIIDNIQEKEAEFSEKEFNELSAFKAA